MADIHYAVRRLVKSNLSFFHEISQKADVKNERGININKKVMNRWFEPADLASSTQFVVTDHWIDPDSKSGFSSKERDINLEGGGKNWRLEGGMVRGSFFGSLRIGDQLLFVFNSERRLLGWACLRGNGTEPNTLGTRVVPAEEITAFDELTAICASAERGDASMWILSDVQGADACKIVAMIHPAIAGVLSIVSATTDVEETDALITAAAKGPVNSTTKQALIEARVGQGKWRKDVLEVWNGCAVTGFKEPWLLRGSHIKPWRTSSNEERLDPANGLPLVAHLDRAFDEGYFSFEDDGTIILSKALSPDARAVLGLEDGFKLAKMSPALASFLKFHRENVLDKSQKRMKRNV